MKRQNLILVSYLFLHLLNSCSKEAELLYWDASSDFPAVIMQNKTHGINPLREGQFYAVRHSDGSISTLYTTIKGLDNIYENGYQYTVELQKVCRIYQTPQYNQADINSNGCTLNLIKLISKSEVAEEFIVQNPYE